MEIWLIHMSTINLYSTEMLKAAAYRTRCYIRQYQIGITLSIIASIVWVLTQMLGFFCIFFAVWHVEAAVVFKLRGFLKENFGGYDSLKMHSLCMTI
jgi:hypothetical protein